MNTITMTATYDDVWWDGDDDDEDPQERGGYTDPRNPWGGFRQEMPSTPGDAGYSTWEAWMGDNVETVSFDNVEEAAQFVIDFPGGVWDLRDGEPEMDYKTGHTISVTLHVDRGDMPAVFAQVEILERDAARSDR